MPAALAAPAAPAAFVAPAAPASAIATASIDWARLRETGPASFVELSVRPLVIAELARIFSASSEAEVVSIADVVVSELARGSDAQAHARFAATLAELCDAAEAAALADRVWRLLPRIGAAAER